MGRMKNAKTEFQKSWSKKSEMALDTIRCVVPYAQKFGAERGRVEEKRKPAQ